MTDYAHLVATVDRLRSSAHIWRLMAEQTLRDGVRYRALGYGFASDWSDGDAIRYLTEARDRAATAADLLDQPKP